MATTRQRPMGCSLTDNLARNLKSFREAEGLSLDDFSTLLRMGRPTIESIERGEENPTLEAVEVIAATLGIEPVLLLE